MLISISMPVPVSPSVAPGLAGGPFGLPGNAHRAAARLRDHVEREVASSYGLPVAEAFHLPVDDAGIQLAQDVVA